jgi:hypothetical protein
VTTGSERRLREVQIAQTVVVTQALLITALFHRKPVSILPDEANKKGILPLLES